jgi:hypothetical protein
VLPLIFTIVFGDKSCNIPLGDLGDFVIEYDLVLTNNGSVPADLAIYGHDVTARAIIQPGASLSAKSYQGGFFSLEAEGAVDFYALLKQAKADVENSLSQKPLSATQAATLDQQLQAINAQMKALRTNPQNGVCWSTLKVGEDGKGGEYDYQATVDSTGKWSVTGFCAN